MRQGRTRIVHHLYEMKRRFAEAGYIMRGMYNVITIGTATRDIFIKSRDFWTEKSSRAAEGRALAMALGAKLEIDEPHFDTGGGATNAAVTFARQHLRTAVVASVGSDPSGTAIVHELKRERVNAEYLKVHYGVRTGISFLLHPEGGERTILVHRGASEMLSPADMPWRKLKTRWFYISSLAGNVALLKEIVMFSKKNGIRVAYNPGGRELAKRKELAPLFKDIEVVIVNRAEAALMTGGSFKNEKLLFRKLHALSPGINVMSDGKRGVWVSDGEKLYKAGTFKEKKIVDRTGAGDAFGSGFVAGLIKATSDKRQATSWSQEQIEYAIRLGSANATSKVEHIGPKLGLLTKHGFADRRWSRLPMRVSRL
jgi:ribokinase